ncbi:nitrate- and nitrite sensing domain-containing protein [Streptomyces sp. WAC 00631]|uniref:sensor histidine kinase n=1 Tax=Streptomyces sp. WAC 00631 TaxID=2203201 RepID=UPI000F765FB7|nr:nitrate- and nitrite sensing domain-containing protein [Streptomyces sp. WAC 00631]MCC5036962.1 nitrate- and nitrite sensing domain-containing protein [Streptomyces sp. WAC 00631]
MRFRGKSIRRKIVALLLVPLVSLVSAWALATALTGGQAKRLLDISPLIDNVGIPAEQLAQTLQRERRQTLVYLADPRSADTLAELHRTESATDEALGAFRTALAAEGVHEKIDGDGGARDRVHDLEDELEGLDSVRRKAQEGTLAPADAFTTYNELVDPCHELLLALHAYALDELELDQEGRAHIGTIRAREALAREDSLLAAALTAGTLSEGDLRKFADRVADRRLLYSLNLAQLPAAERERYEKFWTGSETSELRATEEKLISEGPEGLEDVNAERWQSAAETALSDLDRMGIEAIGRYQERVEPHVTRVLLQAAAVAVLGFLLVIASIAISFRIGRSLARDLSRLRRDAHEMSGVRLPAVMRRLAAGEQVDVEAEAPRLEYGQDEIGQVGQALNTLQRAAVEAAVKQSDMRRGVSEVFVNLARRSQVLLHRQLSLLDTMERRTQDADELADLFKLDHLTTRMRRHAEGLVILSGAASARQWRKPIQLMDVVRAAVAEVEDYERVEVRRLPRLAVAGPAVADLTHLIAELLENATVFSPPHTAVQVHGERVANGFTLEIHDRGLGMTPETLLDANLRLAETPEFELSDTDRLGLFVVSRLAQRQGVRVSLQTSPYGGTTAVVFIPAALLTEKAPEGRDRSEDTTETAAPGGKLAALAQVPVPLGGPSRRGMPALDGPVELEAPDAPEDEVDHEGLLFRARRRTGWHGDRDERTERPDRSARRDRPGPPAAPAAEQHQQARDGDTAGPEVTRSAPRPRRGTPVLVSDHGRPVDAARRTPPPDGETGPGAGPVGPGGLPKRVRQASLAPQLKAEHGPRSEPPPETADPEPDRDAEEVRARMASLQRGWQRGRAHDGDDTGTTGDTAPGTTHEGNGR